MPTKASALIFCILARSHPSKARSGYISPWVRSLCGGVALNFCNVLFLIRAIDAPVNVAAVITKVFWSRLSVASLRSVTSRGSSLRGRSQRLEEPSRACTSLSLPGFLSRSHERRGSVDSEVHRVGNRYCRIIPISRSSAAFGI